MFGYFMDELDENYKIILSVSQRLRCGPGGIAFVCVRLIHITKKIGKLQCQVWLVSTETIYTKQITRKNNIHSPPFIFILKKERTAKNIVVLSFFLKQQLILPDI